jgi:FixJ family two-component response regulator
MPIYIVDDDLSVSKALARLFQASGHEVSVFDSADELLGSVGTDLHGCIILDSRLPGLSGAEMVSRLRKDGCHIPVIVISGDDDQATRRIAKKMGAVGFFRKPIDGIALLDAVNWQLKS